LTSDSGRSGQSLRTWRAVMSRAKDHIRNAIANRSASVFWRSTAAIASSTTSICRRSQIMVGVLYSD
jgi:hypothetical protein